MGYAGEYLTFVTRVSRAYGRPGQALCETFFEACQDMVTQRVFRFTREDNIEALGKAENRLQLAAGELLSRLPEAASVTVIVAAASRPDDTAIVDFIYDLAKMDL